MIENSTWQTLSEAYAFLGNSLLKPMTQTEAVGLDPDFWRDFPHFNDAVLIEAAGVCARFAEDAARRAEAGEDVVQDVSVEYTRLFVGPPKPAAAPWETMYRSDTTVGFGEATFQMKALLREACLELRNENRQYEDHMGIELMYLSEMCRRMQADANKPENASAQERETAIVRFIVEHPLGWAGAFRSYVEEACPQGYFAALLGVAQAMLQWQVDQERAA